MIEIKAYCLFEQSGTFKKQFKSLGYEAEDYDLKNDFGETDHIVDLFETIESAYNEEKTFFDDITEDDIVLAFFPCTRFESMVPLLARCESPQMKKWDDVEKLEYSRNIALEQAKFYDIFCKLVIVAKMKNIKLVIENPVTPPPLLDAELPD